MKTTRLLQTLENQLAQLAAQVAPLAHHATLSARFDRQLFRTRSTLMQDCLEEAQQHFTELRQAVEQQQLPQVAWLAERLVAQIAALSREAATWSLRSWDSASPAINRWQRRRLQHQEYERGRGLRRTFSTLSRCAGKNRGRAGTLNALTEGVTMSLENAPDEVKLAVDLIMLLEENQVSAQTVLGALEIIKRDYENKLNRSGQTSDEADTR